MRGRYIIVVRKEGAPNHGRIYVGRNIKRLIGKVRHEHCRRSSRRIVWTPAMIAYVDANYLRNGMSATMIAMHLSANGKRVTKNAVISKAHARGLSSRRAP